MVGEYKRLCIVPGLSVGPKAFLNVYSIPLITLNGRRNGSNSRIYAMGLLQDQNLEPLRWFLSDFNKSTFGSPKLVATDHYFATTGAIRKVWAQSLLILDHLNQNQKNPHS